jgi:hypothetical protein
MEGSFIPAASPEVVVSSCSSFRSTRRTSIAVLLVALAASAAGVSAAETNGADDYWSGRDALDAAYAARLRGLADRCVELKLDDAAQATRDWVISRDPRRQIIFLPAETAPARPPADVPKIKQQWYDKFTAYRREQAEALFQLARSELQAGRPTRAFQLLHEVLHENPDYEQVRGALGYRLVNSRWRKPESVIQTRRTPDANPDLGFDAGKHWVVESEHFRITTDHSEDAGTQLAEKLEELYDVWQQLFFPYWSSTAVLARRLEGNVPADRSTTRHRVVLFRGRDEYVERLKRLEPQIELSLGYYLETQKTAYFYVDREPRDDLYFHEVTHQLFSETGRGTQGVSLEANAWIVEGVAMYMESIRRRSGFYTAGGIDANRLQDARYRTLNEGSYMPLEQLAALGRRTLQQHEDIRRLYSQSAGLAAFLMDDGRGRNRPLLTKYLQAVYRGRDNARTLASLAGVPLPELDRQYREFLNVTDEDLAFVAFTPETQNLSLGRTAVTDAGLKHVGSLTQLKWLDLAYTAVGDTGLAYVKSAANLHILSAEHTRITDAALETIAGFGELEILNLTGTRITDAGLTHLRSLSNLHELGLGRTAVTDAGLEHLRGLMNLEVLDVNETQVTQEGFQRLKQALPRLKTEAAGAR